MRVLATSDLHGNLPEIEPCDLLLLGGDIAPDFFDFRPVKGVTMNGEEKQFNWFANEFKDWLDDIPAKQVVFIAGNHDFALETYHKHIPDLKLRAKYLRDIEFLYGGLKIWGRPWVPNLPAWAFNGSEAMLQMSAKIIPDDIDILINHGPPFEILNCVDERYGGPKPVGDTHLAERLKTTLCPKHVVCGHIHEQGGNTEELPSGTLVHNTSLVTIDYEPTNPIIELEV